MVIKNATVTSTNALMSFDVGGGTELLIRATTIAQTSMGGWTDMEGYTRKVDSTIFNSLDVGKPIEVWNQSIRLEGVHKGKAYLSVLDKTGNALETFAVSENEDKTFSSGTDKFNFRIPGMVALESSPEVEMQANIIAYKGPSMGRIPEPKVGTPLYVGDSLSAGEYGLVLKGVSDGSADFVVLDANKNIVGGAMLPSGQMQTIENGTDKLNIHAIEIADSVSNSTACARLDFYKVEATYKATLTPNGKDSLPLGNFTIFVDDMLTNEIGAALRIRDYNDNTVAMFVSAARDTKTFTDNISSSKYKYDIKFAGITNTVETQLEVYQHK